jgi:hypothetical protein
VRQPGGVPAVQMPPVRATAGTISHFTPDQHMQLNKLLDLVDCGVIDVALG